MTNSITTGLVDRSKIIVRKIFKWLGFLFAVTCLSIAFKACNNLDEQTRTYRAVQHVEGQAAFSCADDAYAEAAAFTVFNYHIENHPDVIAMLDKEPAAMQNEIRYHLERIKQTQTRAAHGDESADSIDARTDAHEARYLANCKLLN